MDMSTVVPSVAGNAKEGMRIPARCEAAPSSAGLGIDDQSGASTLLFIFVLRSRNLETQWARLDSLWNNSNYCHSEARCALRNLSFYAFKSKRDSSLRSE
jgi:hypothetical protein